MTAPRDPRVALPFQIYTTWIVSAIHLSAVKVAGLLFDILRNESVSTDKLSEHLVGLLLSECTAYFCIWVWT